MTVLDRRSLLLGLGALGLAACGNPPRAYPAETVVVDDPVGTMATPMTSVVMVGDSITRASREELATAFTALGLTQQVIDAEVGRRIEVGNGKGPNPLSGVRTIFNLLALGLAPDVWVVALGTNDVGSYATPEAYGELIDQIVGELSADVPLVWMNAYRRQYGDATNVFNLVLQQRMEARGNAVVADWFSLASAPDADLLGSDNLHPNTDGQRAVAMVVAQALQRDWPNR